MLMPETVFTASNSVNAAFVSFAAELLGRKDPAEPYRNTASEAIGKKSRSYNSKPEGMWEIRQQQITGLLSLI